MWKRLLSHKANVIVREVELFQGEQLLKNTMGGVVQHRDLVMRYVQRSKRDHRVENVRRQFTYCVVT